eukprot:90331-Pelagomonas_calceolata.AAC.6
MGRKTFQTVPWALAQWSEALRGAAAPRQVQAMSAAVPAKLARVPPLRASTTLALQVATATAMCLMPAAMDLMLAATCLMPAAMDLMLAVAATTAAAAVPGAPLA